MSDYPRFPKIPRFHRDVVLTEKIDGSNAQVSITQMDSLESADLEESLGHTVVSSVGCGDEQWFSVRAGSRSRWITPDDDHFGFAAWVRANAAELVELGPGQHYGEWYGKGIQRNYGLDHRRFALFNTNRWGWDNTPDCVMVVPEIVVANGLNLNEVVGYALKELRTRGSLAVPGFMKPEGIVVYHSAARQYFKVLVENDELPKGVAA